MSTEIIDPYTYIERLCTHLQVQYVVPWGKLYHKDLFKNVRYPIGALHEDDCVIHTLAVEAGSIAVCYGVLHFYAINPDSQSRKGFALCHGVNNLEYKNDRMKILENAKKFDILYTVQRLLFFDTIIECQNTINNNENKRDKKTSSKIIFINPKKSKTETLKMLAFLVFPEKIKKYNHTDFLR